VRTQVGIIGAGPAGLLLSQLLHLQGIESVVLERRDRDHVEHRVRAGVLEYGTAQTLREAGVGKRMDAEGMVHEGTELRFAGRGHRIDFAELTGRSIMVYGQQEVVKDLIEARLAAGGDVRFEIGDVWLTDLAGPRPRIHFVAGGGAGCLECDIVVGADGFHGVSRDYLPGLTAYERHYPFAWLGILAQAPPSSHELIYARHERGFALHSMRTPAITRMYLQVCATEDLRQWPDERIWAELGTRLATDDGFVLAQGPLLDKGRTPMRSFVATPMQHRRLSGGRPTSPGG
jgi:p-hydroxybenzoate 3-monooxygenase